MPVAPPIHATRRGVRVEEEREVALALLVDALRAAAERVVVVDLDEKVAATVDHRDESGRRGLGRDQAVARLEAERRQGERVPEQEERAGPGGERGACSAAHAGARARQREGEDPVARAERREGRPEAERREQREGRRERTHEGADGIRDGEAAEPGRRRRGARAPARGGHRRRQHEPGREDGGARGRRGDGEGREQVAGPRAPGREEGEPIRRGDEERREAGEGEGGEDTGRGEERGRRDPALARERGDPGREGEGGEHDREDAPEGVHRLVEHEPERLHEEHLGRERPEARERSERQERCVAPRGLDRCGSGAARPGRSAPRARCGCSASADCGGRARAAEGQGERARGREQADADGVAPGHTEALGQPERAESRAERCAEQVRAVERSAAARERRGCGKRGCGECRERRAEGDRGRERRGEREGEPERREGGGCLPQVVVARADDGLSAGEEPRHGQRPRGGGELERAVGGERAPGAPRKARAETGAEGLAEEERDQGGRSRRRGRAEELPQPAEPGGLDRERTGAGEREERERQREGRPGGCSPRAGASAGAGLRACGHRG